MVPLARMGDQPHVEDAPRLRETTSHFQTTVVEAFAHMAHASRMVDRSYLSQLAFQDVATDMKVVTGLCHTSHLEDVARLCLVAEHNEIAYMITLARVGDETGMENTA